MRNQAQLKPFWPEIHFNFQQKLIKTISCTYSVTVYKKVFINFALFVFINFAVYLQSFRPTVFPFHKQRVILIL